MDDLLEKLVPSPILDKTGLHYKKFKSVYGTPESLEPPDLPAKPITKLKIPSLGWSPDERKIRGLKHCTQCGKPRLFVSKYALPGIQKRQLDIIIKDKLENFSCCMNVNELFTKD